MKIHFVKAGETLYEISKKYGVTVEEIMEANTSVTDPNTIMAGMKLIIPVKKLQTPIPVDSVAPITSSNHQVPLDINPSHLPVYPTQALSQSTPESLSQTTPQPIPQAPANIDHQGFTYPGQAMPPFAANPVPVQQAQPTPQAPTGINQGFAYTPNQAVNPYGAIPLPAQQVNAPVSMPSLPAWTMPTGYTPYNTPYHMNNYTIPNSFPNPPFQGMPQVPSNYQPYPTNMMHYPNSGNYEYYNTYSSLQSNAEWPAHNPQPHSQFARLETTNQDISVSQEDKQQDGNEEKSVSSSFIQDQKPEKKNRTSSTSKERVPMKSKKNSLHDQVVRLQQSRNRSNQR